MNYIMLATMGLLDNESTIEMEKTASKEVKTMNEINYVMLAVMDLLNNEIIKEIARK